MSEQFELPPSLPAFYTSEVRFGPPTASPHIPSRSRTLAAIKHCLGSGGISVEKKYIEKERVHSTHVSSCMGLFAVSGYAQALRCTKQEQLGGGSCAVTPLQQQ